jgi:hypothetical protein
MRHLRQLAWAAVAAAATAAPAAAQTTGGTGGNLGGNGTTGGTTINTGGGTTGGTNGSSSGETFTPPPLAVVEQAPQIRAPSAYVTTNSKVAASNFLGPTAVELRLQGLLANSRNASFAPGALGTQVFPTTTTGTGATARTGGAAGATGRAGGTGSVVSETGGQLVTLPRQIAYTSQLKFAPAPVVAPRLQNNLRDILSRAPTLTNAAGVQVQVDGNAVLLRGNVRDADEARLVEGLVRLTPGVGRITNELAYPR